MLPPMNAKSPRTLWQRPSVWALLLANLVPVYGVLALGWDVFPIVLLFWLENVVIGLLNVLRILLARPDDGASWAAKLFLIPFFLFHYGLFTFVHGSFVLLLFGGGVQGGPGSPFELLGSMREAVAYWNLGIPLLALAASHLFSFFWNYLLGGEYRHAKLPGVMFHPYGRVIVLHVAILVGGMLAMAVGSPAWALLLLLVLKIGLDLKGHVWAHRPPAEPQVA